MDCVIDTCFLVNHDEKALIRWLRQVAKDQDCRIAIDGRNGICAIEVERHAPTAQGARARRMHGNCDGVIKQDVWDIYIRLTARVSKTRIINHDGEPKGELGKELAELRKKFGLHAWWADDRKWIALAQKAAPVNLYTKDKKFGHAADILHKHDILVRDSP